MKHSQAGRAVLLAAAILILFALIAAAIWSFLFARDFALYEESRRQLAEWIDSFGALGPAVILIIQVIQIVIAFLPGEPVEVLAGMVCGAWGGLILCLVGIFIGSSLVFSLVRRFGKPLVNLFFSDEQLYKYRFLRDERSLERLTFILFFIPGTPKDILNYMAGLTKVNRTRFLIISTLARIPSVVTSTIAGDALLQGNLGKMFIFFAVAALMAVAGLRVHSLVTGHMNRLGDEEPGTVDN